MTTERRQARERALALLYEAETKGEAPSAVLDDQLIAPDPFTVDLVSGVGDAGAELDELISRFARGWRLERMAALDRAVLRLGSYELTHHPEIPTGVVLSEAVELASTYSTEDSGPFVNGVLAAIAAEVRHEQRDPASRPAAD